MKVVLLIEDNNEIRENMAEILELAGYETIAASNGKQGFTVAKETKPDIIICDIMMPELDGYGVLHMLQQNPVTQNIPFIFLTAKAEREEFRKGMELGADDYITKPFNGTELLNAVALRLRKSEMFKMNVISALESLNSIINYASETDILQKLTQEGNIHTYEKRKIIYNKGSHATKLYYVQEGVVKTYQNNEDGKDFVTAIYNKGDFFGYIPMLEQTTYKETAEALQDSEIAVIPRDSFEELLHGNPDVLRKFVELLAKNVVEKEQQLLGLAYNSVRQRVANALIVVYDKYKLEGDHQSINISREDLATIAATARESLTRTLAGFKADQLIDIQRSRIVILDEKRLRNLAR